LPLNAVSHDEVDPAAELSLAAWGSSWRSGRLWDGFDRGSSGVSGPTVRPIRFP
jgi:hypothetical protein